MIRCGWWDRAGQELPVIPVFANAVRNLSEMDVDYAVIIWEFRGAVSAVSGPRPH